MTMDEPWQVSDEGAKMILVELLTAAVEDMAALAQPTMVAASPFKHDDMGGQQDWLAVQVGRARWERTAYGLGEVEERSINPDHLVVAQAVLRRLQQADWRALGREDLCNPVGSRDHRSYPSA